MRLTLGITQRITLWWIVLFAAGLLSFAILAALAVERAQRADLDAELLSQARYASNAVNAQTGEFAAPIPPSDVPDIRILSFRGSSFVELRGPPLPRTVIDKAATIPTGKPTSIKDGEAYRVLTTISPTKPNIRVVILAGEYPVEESEERVRNAFLIAAVPILTFAGIVGWLLARRSLAPIARITDAAADIARSGRLSTRLALQTEDELGRLARTFDAMLARIEASFVRERGFIGDVSHELRNAVAAIATEAEHTLSSVRDADAYQDALHTIASRAKRLGRTIDDLLLFARADAGTLETRQRGEINEIVSQACAQLQRRETGKSVEVTLSEQPLMVVGSPELLERVVANLVSNARRAAQSAVRVTVCENSGRAIVEVDDDGCGIPTEERETIFRRFYRRSADNEGTGLGLPIVAAITNAYGGSVRIADSPDGGARFTVEFPLAP